jgi:hypothetical protein
MSKKKRKQKVRIYYKKGGNEIIPQKFWDDYEYINNNFVLKKNEQWIGIYNMDCIACIEIW